MVLKTLGRHTRPTGENGSAGPFEMLTACVEDRRSGDQGDGVPPVSEKAAVMGG